MVNCQLLITDARRLNTDYYFKKYSKVENVTNCQVLRWVLEKRWGLIMIINKLRGEKMAVKER